MVIDLSDLCSQLNDLVLKLDCNIVKRKSIKRDLRALEDQMVEVKEKISSIKETIRREELSQDFNSLIDLNRQEEIVSFRDRMQDTLNKLK